jgi:hypothetical protein
VSAQALAVFSHAMRASVPKDRVRFVFGNEAVPDLGREEMSVGMNTTGTSPLPGMN